ncbi:aminotransferase-like domain-containing protein [Risungbinella massiliensis]|uniref:aminotransferase-like domain-containing protein n=1 Tax=Risungbinella massiliensis TaxID=1329796 RepID=UPI0005CC3DD3|nr:PLP-dependent aminotransferase family protein [Risungbinella massiliensis]
MNWKPDRKKSTPLYRQIKQHIQEKISNGEWAEGSTIPTQRDLAASWQVNRSTVVTAVEELIADGYLEGDGRRGTKVAQNAWNKQKSVLDWQQYSSAGVWEPNIPTIQKINQMEADSNMIRLGTGEMASTLFPKEQFQKIFQELGENVSTFGYGEPKGLSLLREEIRLYLQELGINVSTDSILIVSGALQAFQLISQGLVQSGWTLFSEKSSYLYTLPIFRSAGVHMVGWELDELGVRIPNDISKRRGFLYTIPTYQNPTGAILPEQRREEILAFSRLHQLPIIEDGAYQELYWETPPPLSLKARPNSGNVLYIGTLSKTVSPGLRIGWVVGAKTVIDRLADLKMQTDYGSSILSQWVAKEWFGRKYHIPHLQVLRAKLRERKEFLIQLLENYLKPYATWNNPSGGYYIWLRFHTKISIHHLFSKALTQKVLLHPGYIYQPDDRNHLRLSFCYEPKGRMEEGIKRLAKLVEEMI